MALQSIEEFGFVYFDRTAFAVSFSALFLLALILTMKFALAFFLSATTGAALGTEPQAEVLLARSLQHHQADEMELERSVTSKDADRCDAICGTGNYATCRRTGGRMDAQCCGSVGDGIQCGMSVRSNGGR